MVYKPLKNLVAVPLSDIYWFLFYYQSIYLFIFIYLYILLKIQISRCIKNTKFKTLMYIKMITIYLVYRRQKFEYLKVRIESWKAGCYSRLFSGVPCLPKTDFRDWEHKENNP